MADIEITNQYASKQDIYSWFETDDFPTEAQFRATWDSYWHKSESIPMASISGLVAKFNQTVSKSTFESHLKDEDAHVTTLAKIDASNINVQLWKKTLGVGALPANIATIDYTDGNGNALEGNAYKKVENPNDGNVYVLNIDGTKVNANTFGKNITNSSNTTTGSYVQSQATGHTWIWDTNGQSWSIKNLPDKSADANFTDIVGKNPNGQFAKVGFPALKSMVSGFSQEQSLEISQLLNAGVGAAGMMSVNTIAPPLFERENNNVYLVLRGANLDLNTLAMAIHIVRASDNTVVAQTPNSQIQLYADGLSLYLWYNFYSLGVGDYKLRITSGAKVLITSLQFKIVTSVENINIGAITWNKLIDPAIITNDLSVASGGNVQFQENSLKYSTTPVISFLSSELFAQGDDWYVELQVSTGTHNSSQNPALRVGVCYSTAVNQLSFLPIHFFDYSKTWAGFRLYTKINTNTNGIDRGGVNSSITTFVVSITKIGNTITITDGTQIGIMTISNNYGYSLSAQMPAFSNPDFGTGIESPSINIVKAFKIN
ncbi:hypothetical protein [Epilithonimonas hominis]|uniref:hypothetical protein n=1 Tax=Epilithonimonas hominis TaxID=420404 RepID=UPI000EE7283E|nr:hypothetical protein [Epilithonimonas hominis]HAP94530.1 hypothetical protein [Chryseobacterium sp.]